MQLATALGLHTGAAFPKNIVSLRVLRDAGASGAKGHAYPSNACDRHCNLL